MGAMYNEYMHLYITKLRLIRNRIKFSTRSEKLRWITIVMIILTFTVITKARQYMYMTFPSNENRLLSKTLINLNGFELKSNDQICRKKDEGKKLLQIGIHSGRRNYNRRNAIRESWGSMKMYKNWEISTAFLLGSASKTSNNKNNNTQTTVEKVINSTIEREQQTHSDLVIGNFEDTYRNLTYKHMMGYKWVLDHCPQVSIYIKTDDDVFLNVPKIVDWLESTKVGNNIYCYLLRGYSPWRSKRYKFYISKDEYKPNKFPDYCSGIGYITTSTVMSKLLDISIKAKYLWVEDLFVTGLLTNYYNAQQIAKQLFSLRNNNTPANHSSSTIRLEDQSQYYLNEQYDTYKNWLDDASVKTNPWMFILLEKSNDQDLVIDQKSLFHKTQELAIEFHKHN